MSPLLTILIILLATTLISVTGSIAATLLVRAPLEEVGIFFGRPIFKTTVQGVRVLLGWLPTGGYVSVKGLAFENPDEEDSSPALNKGARVAIYLASPLALLLAGSVCVGAGRAIHSFVTGLYQAPMGALHPLSLGKQYLQWTLDVLHGQGLTAAIGIVWIKLAALHVLPFMQAGGRVLLSLAGERVSHRFRERYQFFCIVMEMLVFSAWAIALFALFLHYH